MKGDITVSLKSEGVKQNFKMWRRERGGDEIFVSCRKDKERKKRKKKL